VLEPWIIEQIRRREEEERRRQEQPRLEIPARDERWKPEHERDRERERERDGDTEDEDRDKDRGVVIIDMRDFAGIVFGGDQMTAWTLMSGPTRTTFVNPQAGLYDRIASVKAIATETPVEGRIVFTKRAKFPKGLPRFTVMLDSVAAEFPKLGAAELDIAVSKYRPGWAKLKEAAKPSPHFRSNPIAVA